MANHRPYIDKPCGWFFGKLQNKTRTETERLANHRGGGIAASHLIKDLTEHNNRLVEQYLEEQSNAWPYRRRTKPESGACRNLAEQVSRLTVKVEKLERTIKRLAQKMKKIVFLTISIATFGCNASRHTVKVRRGDRRAHGHRNRRHRNRRHCRTHTDSDPHRAQRRCGNGNNRFRHLAPGRFRHRHTSRQDPHRTETPHRHSTAQDLSEGRQTSATHVTDSITDERSESRTIAELSRKGLNPLQRALLPHRCYGSTVRHSMDS